MEYNITKHAEERYAERIKNRERFSDVQRFIMEHKTKIKDDINKMIAHGELIYHGKNFKDRAGIVDVYLKDFWVVFTDPKTKNVITLYRIDFGAGDEFNKNYLDIMMENIRKAQEEKEQASKDVLEQVNAYTQMIADMQGQINEYKSMVKNLENLCADYRDIVENITVRETQADLKLSQAVNSLIGRREF